MKHKGVITRRKVSRAICSSRLYNQHSLDAPIVPDIVDAPLFSKYAQKCRALLPPETPIRAHPRQEGRALSL